MTKFINPQQTWQFTKPVKKKKKNNTSTLRKPLLENDNICSSPAHLQDPGKWWPWLTAGVWGKSLPLDLTVKADIPVLRNFFTHGLCKVLQVLDFQCLQTLNLSCQLWKESKKRKNSWMNRQTDKLCCRWMHSYSWPGCSLFVSWPGEKWKLAHVDSQLLCSSCGTCSCAHSGSLSPRRGSAASPTAPGCVCGRKHTGPRAPPYGPPAAPQRNISTQDYEGMHITGALGWSSQTKPKPKVLCLCYDSTGFQPTDCTLKHNWLGLNMNIHIWHFLVNTTDPNS